MSVESAKSSCVRQRFRKWNKILSFLVWRQLWLNEIWQKDYSSSKAGQSKVRLKVSQGIPDSMLHGDAIGPWSKSPHRQSSRLPIVGIVEGGRAAGLCEVSHVDKNGTREL